MFLGSIVKPGFNPLAAPTPSYTYYLYGWGGNPQGQLGLGNRTSYSSPKQVGSLTTWSNGASGPNFNFAFAVKTDGTLWSWGLNSSGQLGINNSTSYSSPKQVGSLTNWINVSAGTTFTITVKS